MKPWRVFRMVFACAGVIACSSDGADVGQGLEESEGCIPGATVACACTDGTQSVQSCAPAGDGYLPCGCDGSGSVGYPQTGGAPPLTGTGGVAYTGTGGVAYMGTGGVAYAGAGGTPVDPSGTGGVPYAGTGGEPVIGTGGIPYPATGGVPNNTGGTEPGTGGAPVGTGGTPPILPGSQDPIIPAVTGTCPTFANSTITFMGLGGIQIVAGTKRPGPTAPMVFYWHGTGSTSGEFAFMAAAVQQGVVAEGGVLVSFQSTSGGDIYSGTNIFGAADFNITDQLVACAVRDHNVDPRRIFATGCSAGGLFSAAMAAMRSNYVAAAAPNSGGWVIPVTFQSTYTPALMTIHGAAGQDVVGVDFSNTSATADQAFSARGGFVINCDHGGGHCGGSGLAPDIWEFFQTHPYGVDPEPWASGLPAGFSSYCAIY